MNSSKEGSGVQVCRFAQFHWHTVYWTGPYGNYLKTWHYICVYAYICTNIHLYMHSYSADCLYTLFPVFYFLTESSQVQPMLLAGVRASCLVDSLIVESNFSLNFSTAIFKPALQNLSVRCNIWKLMKINSPIWKWKNETPKWQMSFLEIMHHFLQKTEIEPSYQDSFLCFH